jgi:hypothetical protein
MFFWGFFYLQTQTFRYSGKYEDNWELDYHIVLPCKYYIALHNVKVIVGAVRDSWKPVSSELPNSTCFFLSAHVTRKQNNKLRTK